MELVLAFYFRVVPVALLVVVLFLTGCQQEVVANVDVAPVAEPVMPVVVVEPTAVLPPPALIATNTPSAPRPSFAAVDPVDVAGARQDMLVQATAVLTEGLTAVITPVITPTITPTAPPTFTPPALPFTSPDEHFWFQRPIPEGGTVWTDKSYPYGSTRGGTLRPHHGVEFYVPQGTPVLATASGTVVVAGDDSAIVYGEKAGFYGKLVIIQHDSAWNEQPVFTLYAHLSEIYVNEGQRVNALAPIALSGATGVADGPHLHFEVRLGENSYASTRNPLLWLYPFPDYGAVAGRVVRGNGSLVEEAPISLRRIDAPARYMATTSYAGNSVNPDDQWQENFALDDVPAGYYEITVAVGSERFTQELWVFAYRTSFVEVEIEE
jgi:murein DD-endopeptidase MepM/ murein hydrolase activator NlpD